MGSTGSKFQTIKYGGAQTPRIKNPGWALAGVLRQARFRNDLGGTDGLMG
jgi:hypothetical protein